MNGAVNGGKRCLGEWLAGCLASAGLMLVTIDGTASAQQADGVPVQADATGGETGQAVAGETTASGKAEELKRAIADIVRRLEEQRDQREAANADPEAGDVSRPGEEMEALSASLAALRAERDDLLAELENARAELTATRERLVASEESRQQAANAAATLKGGLEGRIAELDSEGRKLRNENADLSRQLAESVEQIQTVRQSVNEAWRERDGFETALAETEAERAILKEAIDGANAEIGELTGSLEAGERERIALEEQLAERDERIAAMQVTVAQKEDEVRQALALASARKNEFEREMAATVDLAEARANALDQELAELREVAGQSIVEVRNLGEQLIAAIAENEDLTARAGELSATKTLLIKELEAARRDVELYAAEAASLRGQLMGEGPLAGSGAPAPDENGRASLQVAALERLEGEEPAQLVALSDVEPAEQLVAAVKDGTDAATVDPLAEGLSELNAVETADGWLMTVPEGIDFAPGSDQFTDDTARVLGKVAALIDSYDANAVRIVGHTDSNGDAGANLELSERRAGSVKRYLVETFGIADAIVGTEGYGESRPIASNDSREGRRANRRVEVYLKR